MLGNVISVRDLRQTFTNLEEFSILFPALGHSLNGVWILWVLSLKQSEIKSIYWSTQIILPSGSKLSL